MGFNTENYLLWLVLYLYVFALTSWLKAVMPSNLRHNGEKLSAPVLFVPTSVEVFKILINF